MCTYATEHAPLTGRARTPEGWEAVDQATVYFDHPVAFPATHSLNIDVFAREATGLRRLSALELDVASARALATAILSLLDSTPPELLAESATTGA
ncbi:conserved hypothetical protein [Acidimicrobium ferrooxidans DSM 10331]|uniref:Uncharacterized protein n=1 Tax=Acidimicrobium ferrooxidans (strain DSM 10331 / JCM 15462 / NBRC 103882 / ICP) TaxID=525909 RepID=C7M255_ACIFD|nr:DUF6295 family protein [Acidimicrobium ferrooxidans]ACU53153.1 conserved hypothetical protein [Acidimicrobium ferrooxidans DSM 10331]